MLTELRISNFAVIDRLSVEFTKGFQVLTGETGAGKSILIDAIALLIGARASTEQIRTDAEEAEVEGLFSLQEAGEVGEVLREVGAIDQTENEVIIRRVISKNGRNRIYVNGRLTPLHVIQRLAGLLVDIHGQHEQQSLLSPLVQLNALDTFGNLLSLRKEYAVRYREWQKQIRELERLEGDVREAEKQKEFLHFQHTEIEEAGLTVGEEEQLLHERGRLVHTVRLGELGDEAFHSLYQEDHSVLSKLGVIKSRLRELCDVDSSVIGWVPLCEEVMANLQDLADQLRDYLQHLDQDPDHLSALEERLEVIQRLKKKYGGTIESILEKNQSLSGQLKQIESSSSDIELLHSQIVKNEDQLCEIGKKLTKKRLEASQDLEQRVGKELSMLRMEDTRFSVNVLPLSEVFPCSESGCERVEFLFSANKGESLQSLTSVASGGELSRVMLAVKTVLAESDHVPVLIFDEVDSGIGGAVAEVMGRRLKALGKFHQVLCITHQPQIASLADQHFFVKKSVKGNRTYASINVLNTKERHDEIARMLGGVTITKKVRDTAAEMIGVGKRKP